MATNIDYLPIVDTGLVVVATNADWIDNIIFLIGPGNANAGQPLDLTGISFFVQIRPTVADTQVLLDASTDNGLLVVNAAQGALRFNVPRDQPSTGPIGHMLHLPVGSAVMDIVAKDSTGKIVNLCGAGAISVTINRGVTR